MSIYKAYKRNDGKVFFCGYPVSEEGLKHNRIDYRALSQAVGGAVLNNNILSVTDGVIGYWDAINGYIDNYFEDDDIYQYYVISESGAELLQKFTNDFVFYNSYLDMYLWGITHYGTAWNYVLTDIEIKFEED